MKSEARIEQIRQRAEAYGNPRQGYRTERDVFYAEDVAYLLERIENLEIENEHLKALCQELSVRYQEAAERIEKLEARSKRLNALASSTAIVLDHFDRGTGSTLGLENVRGHLEGLGYC